LKASAILRPPRALMTFSCWRAVIRSSPALLPLFLQPQSFPTSCCNIFLTTALVSVCTVFSLVVHRLFRHHVLRRTLPLRSPRWSLECLLFFLCLCCWQPSLLLSSQAQSLAFRTCKLDLLMTYDPQMLIGADLSAMAHMATRPGPAFPLPQSLLLLPQYHTLPIALLYSNTRPPALRLCNLRPRRTFPLRLTLPRRLNLLQLSFTPPLSAQALNQLLQRRLHMVRRPQVPQSVSEPRLPTHPRPL